MKKNKLQLEVWDPTGNLVRRHHFHYEAGQHNKVTLNIGDNLYTLSPAGKLLETLIEEEPKSDVVLVNGKEYPMWNQFVAEQDKWIGGTLEEYGDSFDRAMELEMMATPITKIELRPNGEESAFFEVHGKDFSCGFDVGHGGIQAGEEGWITFSGYGGHLWRIKSKEE